MIFNADLFSITHTSILPCFFVIYGRFIKYMSFADKKLLFIDKGVYIRNDFIFLQYMQYKYK